MMEIDICPSFQEWCGVISEVIGRFFEKKINFFKDKYQLVQIIAERTADDFFEKILISSEEPD